MSEVLLFSDIHIHPHIKNADRVGDCIRVLKWVFDTAKKRKIKNVLFGGDLLHDRQLIDIMTYCTIYQSLKEILDGSINFYILLGNHDIWYNEKTTVSGVYPFDSLPSVKVISNPSTLNIDGYEWDFLPFTHNPIEDMSKFMDKQKERYFLGHIGIDEARLDGSGRLSEVEIEHDGEIVKVSKDLFVGYKHSFFGHYHSAQKLAENVEYIGSPLELSFGEAQESKHIIVFNQKTNVCEYIKNDFSPKHYYVKTEEELDRASRKQCFICVLGEDKTFNEVNDLMNKASEKDNVIQLKFKKLKKEKVQEINTNVSKEINEGGDILKQFVDMSPTTLDKSILNALADTIVLKSQEKK